MPRQAAPLCNNQDSSSLATARDWHGNTEQEAPTALQRLSLPLSSSLSGNASSVLRLSEISCQRGDTQSDKASSSAKTPPLSSQTSLCSVTGAAEPNSALLRITSFLLPVHMDLHIDPHIFQHHRCLGKGAALLSCVCQAHQTRSRCCSSTNKRSPVKI